MNTHVLDLSALDGGVNFPASGTNVLSLVKQWRGRASQRRVLAQLTAEQLNDVGISPEEAAAEVAKHFWQA